MYGSTKTINWLFDLSLETITVCGRAGKLVHSILLLMVMCEEKTHWERQNAYFPGSYAPYIC